MRRRDQRHREQPSLFDSDAKCGVDSGPPAEPAIEPIDPNVIERDAARLIGQNRAIIERLARGPATNDELARLSRKYTSRISDVRRFLEQRGHTIVCDRGVGGLNTYRIVSTHRMEA